MEANSPKNGGAEFSKMANEL